MNCDILGELAAWLDVRELFRFLRVNRRMLGIARGTGAIVKLSNLNWPQAVPGVAALQRIGRIAAWTFTPTLMDRRTVPRGTGKRIAVNEECVAFMTTATVHVYMGPRSRQMYIGAPMDIGPHFDTQCPNDICLQRNGTVVLARGAAVEVICPRGRRMHFWPPCHRVTRIATHRHNAFLAVTDYGCVWRCRYHHVGLSTETTHMGTLLAPSRCKAGKYTGPIICTCTVGKCVYMGCTYGLFMLDQDEQLTCILHGAPVVDMCEFTGGLAAISAVHVLSIFKANTRVGNLQVPHCRGISSFRHLVFCGGTTVNTRTMAIRNAAYPHIYHRVVTSDGRRALEHLAIDVVVRKEMQAVPMVI